MRAARDPIGRGWALVTSAEVIRLAFGFVASVVVARALGPANYGVYAVLAAMVGVVGILADGGLSEAGVLRLAQGSGSARAFLWLRIGLAAIVVAVLCLAAGPLAARLLGLPDDGTLTRWALIGVLATAGSGGVSVLLQAQGRFGAMSTLTLLNTVATAVLAVALAVVGQLTVATALVVLGIGTSLATFAVGLRLARPDLEPPRLTVIQTEARALLRTGAWLWLAALLAMLAANLDVLIVNRFAALQTVGAYALATNLASKANLANHSLYTVLLPRVAQLHDRAAVKRYLSQALQRSAIAAAALALCVPFAQPFVMLIYGDQFAAAVPLLQLLLAAVIFDVLATPILLLPLAYGRARVMAAADGVRALTLVALGAALVPLYGVPAMVGARFASRIAGAIVVLGVLGRSAAPFQVQHEEAAGVSQSR